MTYQLYENDLPPGLDLGPMVAVDTETMGLDMRRDRLCLVQLSSGDGKAHLVRLSPGRYEAPNLRRLLADQRTTKLYHYARFDLAALSWWLGVWAAPVWCTKVASKLVRTFTDKHGLKDLCRELIGVELHKQAQSSDWGAPSLTDEQLRYAASDVLHLHALKDRLETMLEREKRQEIAAAAFAYLPTRATLDLMGWSDMDILSH